MDTNILFNIGCGLYLLTANENGKDNGCIINTVMQVAQNPCQIIIAVNKENYTTSIIQNTKKFNVSILDEETKFEIIKNFGYQSGKNIDKFENFQDIKRLDNGILYLTKYSNSYLSAEVIDATNLGTHIMFRARVLEAQSIKDCPTLTYDFYQKNIKPKPENTESGGWRCKICGYIYKEKDLPQDYICPLCKHGVSDFERI